MKEEPSGPADELWSYEKGFVLDAAEKRDVRNSQGLLIARDLLIPFLMEATHSGPKKEDAAQAANAAYWAIREAYQGTWAFRMTLYDMLRLHVMSSRSLKRLVEADRCWLLLFLKDRAMEDEVRGRLADIKARHGRFWPEALIDVVEALGRKETKEPVHVAAMWLAAMNGSLEFAAHFISGVVPPDEEMFEWPSDE